MWVYTGCKIAQFNIIKKSSLNENQILQCNELYKSKIRHDLL